MAEPPIVFLLSYSHCESTVDLPALPNLPPLFIPAKNIYTSREEELSTDPSTSDSPVDASACSVTLVLAAECMAATQTAATLN